MNQKESQPERKELSAPHSNAVIIPVLKEMSPWLIAIIPFVLKLWSIGLAIVIVGGIFITLRQWNKKKQIGSFQLTSLALLAVVSIAYFGFGNIYLLLHFGLVIYSLLLIPVIYGEIRGAAFTEYYAKQMVPKENWGTPAFKAGNHFISRLWGITFAIAIVFVLLGNNTTELVVIPNVLIVIMLLASTRIAHSYATKYEKKSAVKRNAPAL